MDYVSNRITNKQPRGFKEILSFLSKNDLKLDEGVSDFIEIRLNGDIVACGGLDKNIIKCVAIDSQHRGEGLTFRLVTELLNIAHENHQSDLFLFTKPENKPLFTPCGFFPIVQYQDSILMMENSPDRLKNYCGDLHKQYHEGKKISSIVMNANPFTLGHRHLVEYAASQCDWLHVFLVKEDASFFSYKDRFALVEKGICDISNVTLHQGSDYIISRASFPNYFLKNEEEAENGYTALDLKIFRQYIAPALNINIRFVGTEPIDIVTGQYNKDMIYYLSEEKSDVPEIKVVVCPRVEYQGKPISASRVRAALKEKDFEAIKNLVPDTTYEYLVENYS